MHRVARLGVLFWIAFVASGAPVDGQVISDSSAPHPSPPQDSTILSIAQARGLALEQSPSARALMRRTAVAEGALRTARTYPFNPRLDVEAPTGWNEARSGSWTAQFSQEVEWAGQGGIRSDIAEEGLKETRAAVEDEIRLILRDVEHAYHALAAAERRLEVAVEIDTLTSRLIRAVRIELAEGETSRMQSNLAEIEVTRAKARVFELEAQRSTAALRLGLLVGIPPRWASDLRVSPEPVDSFSDTDERELLEQALERRPDLRAARASAAGAGAALRLASRARIPDLTVSALAEGAAGSGSTRVGFSVGLPIPVFDRNQGLRASRTAELDQQLLLVDAREAAVRSDVSASLQTLRAATAELELMESGIVQPVRDNLALLEVAYREGTLDLPSLLLLRNQLFDAELDYWDAWERHRGAVVAVRSATASILNAIPLEPSEASR